MTTTTGPDADEPSPGDLLARQVADYNFRLSAATDAGDHGDVLAIYAEAYATINDPMTKANFAAALAGTAMSLAMEQIITALAAHAEAIIRLDAGGSPFTEMLERLQAKPRVSDLRLGHGGYL